MNKLCTSVKTLQPGNIDPDVIGVKTVSSLSSLINWGLAFSFVILFIFLIRAGYTYMTSAGVPQKREAAKQRMITVVIAMALVGAFGTVVSIAQFIFY